MKITAILLPFVALWFSATPIDLGVLPCEDAESGDNCILNDGSE